MDALTHAIESLHSMQREPIADGLAIHAIRLIWQYLPRAVADGTDLQARGQMLLAASIAGAAFSNAQVGLGHAMAHTVGARHGVHHGLANSILLPHVMRFNAEEVAGCYRHAAEAMGLDVRGMDDPQAAEAAAQAVSDLAAEIGLSQHLSAQGVPAEALGDLADGTLEDAAIVYNGRMVMDASEVLEVFEAAF